MTMAGWALVLASATIGSTSWAQECVDCNRKGDAALDAAGSGAFLPESLGARIGSARVFAFGSGGFDSAQRGPLADTAVEAAIFGSLALRAQATYSDPTARMRPSIGARMQLLRQEREGLDGALTVVFKTEGFTETEGEIEANASLARRFGRTSLIGNLVYGQDPEGNERDAEIRAALLHQRNWLVVGVDSRARFAIGTQHGRAATTEPVFDILAWPFATAAEGPVALFAQAGPSALQLANSPAQIGVAMLAGIGAAY